MTGTLFSITNVKIGVRSGWGNLNHNGNIELRENINNISSGWVPRISASSWTDLDITSAETTWTKAKIDALQVSTRRQYVNEPNSSYFVDAFRIVITIE